MSRDREEGLSIGQEHELIEKLKKAGISVKEVQAVITAPDNLLAKKLVEVANEYAQDKRAEYERLFYSQLQSLTSFGYPASWHALLKEQKDQVIEFALGMNMSSTRTPFLPVIPREFRSAFDQFYDLGIKPFIDLSRVEYEDDVPKLPYYIFSIETELTSGMPAEDARFSLLTEHQPPRIGMTDVEIAALLNHVFKPQEEFSLLALNAKYLINKSSNKYEYVVGVHSSEKTVSGHSWTREYSLNLAPSLVNRLRPELTKEQVETCLAKGRYYS